MMQCTLYITLLAFLLRPASSSGLRCETTSDFLKCSCLFDDFSYCATDLFTSQDFSGISKLHINCDNGHLPLAHFTQLAEAVVLADLTVVQCELTDWHTTEAVPTALSGLKRLTITQSFSRNVFPNFGNLFETLQHFTFYSNYLHSFHNNVPFVQPFQFTLENAVVCNSQSYVVEGIGAELQSNGTEFLMHNRSCFCTFINSSVQLYCFGAHTLDLENALNAVASMPQYTNRDAKRINITAINLHNLQFLINDSPDSHFDTILEQIVPSAGLAGLNNGSTDSFIFQVDTCEEIGIFPNATDAWKELQWFLCPLNFVTNVAKVSVINCVYVQAIRLIDHVSIDCGLLRRNDVEYIDMSNNNITMDQYLPHFIYQTPNLRLTVFNCSGNFLGILEPMFFYLITPTNLRYVDLSYSNVNGVQDNPFDYLDNVEWMSLAGNFLEYVQYYWFSGLRNLKYLDLSSNYQLNGVWALGTTYPQIWPESLEYLDLSETNLVDSDDQRSGGTFGQRFTDKFFYGLGNLLVLNLSHTRAVLTAELFKPLGSLEVLNLTGGFRVASPSHGIPKDLLKNVGHLRRFYTVISLSAGDDSYNFYCQFFKYTLMLSELEIKSAQHSPPECVNLLGLYNWLQWKRRGNANFTLLEETKLLCTFNGAEYSFADLQAMMADRSGDFYLSLTFNESTTPPSVKRTVPMLNKISHPEPPAPHPSEWTQMQMPLFACLAIILLVILLCIPTRIMFHASMAANKQTQTNDAPHNSVYTLSRPRAQSFRDKRKELKQTFFEETLMNGFLFAYRSKLIIERLAWYAVILAFTGILVFQIIGLWQQFYYSEPSTQSTMVSAARFPQNSFTICVPVKKRNHYELTQADIYRLAEDPMCEENDGLSLPMGNSLLRDMVMFRIGAQMAWEGGTLHRNFTITEAIKTIDDIVFGRNLSYRTLLTEVNGLLCKLIQLTASMRRMDSNETPKILVNPAGCADIFKKPGFGLTWYDLLETDTACLRFPGLFTFTGFQEEGILHYQPWQFFYSPTPAKIELGGYEYPLAAGPNSHPTRANIHHDTSLSVQLKSVFRSLETYRSKTNRCYKNCVATIRVAEIQTQCNCRPLMFADWSDPSLPDCTLDIYEKCGLSLNGDLKYCDDTVPCEVWDFGVLPTDNGLTPDNSTIIRFGGMNTLYVVYEEQDARTAINFMGDVGGVLGLWLGGSMVAIVHIFFFCLKSIYFLVPWFGRKCGQQNGGTTSEIYPV